VIGMLIGIRPALKRQPKLRPGAMLGQQIAQRNFTLAPGIFGHEAGMRTWT
jgi:hypothetical protein